MTYSVYCFRFNNSPVKVYSGLTLKQAQKICKDPDTSSKTTTDQSLINKWGDDHWFYGYEED
jgi:hypothetical protein